MLKRISKTEAAEKYGVLVNGVNSLYNYFVREDGCVVDSGGDIRYYPPGYYEFIENNRGQLFIKNDEFCQQFERDVDDPEVKKILDSEDLQNWKKTGFNCCFSCKKWEECLNATQR